MKMKKSFIWLGIALVLLSVVTAVYGLEYANTDYRLWMKDVTAVSEDSLRVKLVNADPRDLELVDLHYYTIESDGVKTRKQFSHTVAGEVSAVGIMESNEAKSFVLPAEGLSCSEVVTVEVYTYKGKLVSYYSALPYCQIKEPRSLGLVNLDDCTAEFYDGTLRIKWELIDADAAEGKVKIRKTFGSLAPEDSWEDVNSCMDWGTMMCLTKVSDIEFDGPHVSVTLMDNRRSTSAVLRSDEEAPCFETKQIVVAPVVPEPKPAVAPAPVVAPVETMVVKADSDPDIRVCLEGCKAFGQCYMEETRANYMGRNVYCKGQNWMVQKVNGNTCSADYECSSEICSAGECTTERLLEKESWITRMLKWLDNLI